MSSQNSKEQKRKMVWNSEKNSRSWMFIRWNRIPMTNHVFFMYSYKSKAKEAQVKMMGAIGMVMNFDFLQCRRFRCSSELECFQWVVVFNKLIREVWQRECESLIIKSPEIYQYHAFVIKMNQKGKTQDRTILLSNEWIYNIEVIHNPTSIKDKKWAYPFKSLKAVFVGTENGANNPSITLYFNEAIFSKIDKAHIGSKKEKMNDKHTFIFFDDAHCIRMVTELKRLFFFLSNENALTS